MKPLMVSMIAILSVTISASPLLAQQAEPAVRRLSIDEAVRLALEQNVDMRVERLNPRIQELSIAEARTAWTPNLTATVNDGRSNLPTTNIFAGASGLLTRDEFGTNVGWNQLLPWGASYSVSWDNSRVRSNSLFDSPNPALSSGVSLSYVQPLLRNFRIDGARQQLLVTKANREISDIELAQSVVNTVRKVKIAYWNLAYAMSSLLVQRQSVELARASLRNSRLRLDAGMTAPLEVVEAESEVAQRAEAVIVAEGAVGTAEDQLRALIFDRASSDSWNVKLEPTDVVGVGAIAADAQAAVNNALDGRSDLRAARKALGVADVGIRYLENQKLPDVRLEVDHGMAGQSGTALQFGAGFPPTVVGQQTAGYGTALRGIVDNDRWRVSLAVSYPIGTSAAEAAVARAKVQRTQAEARIRSLEMQVATEVREAERQVRTNARRIDATKAARELAEKRLEAEGKRFAAGLSTTFVVFQAQRDLAQARNAELRATLDYNTSVVDFESIQLAPLAGARR